MYQCIYYVPLRVYLDCKLIINNNGLLYSAHAYHSVKLLALNHYYPGFCPAVIMALEHYKE